MPSFDSREYAFSDITLMLGGKDLVGLKAIKYGAKQDKKLRYGKGNKPLGIQRGNISYEGELAIAGSEYETLTANSKTGSVLDLRLDAVVAYGNPSNGDALLVDVLKGVEFTEEAKDWKQGDAETEIKLPFIFIDKKNQMP